MRYRLSRTVSGNRHLVVSSAILLFFFFISDSAFGANGPCVDCHTMHNSQNNLPMNYDNSAVPNDQLLRGTCYGCHAQGGAALVSTGSDTIPQVLHTDVTDLAGGNFQDIIDLGDNRGHNISDLTGVDGILFEPPGGIVQIFHDDGFNVNTNVLQCAGTNGCHGNRYSQDPAYPGIDGSHHDNVNGSVNPASTDKEPGHSYRFLLGVVGFEDDDWQFTKTAASHNEYYGLATPASLDCSAGGCHLDGGVRPPDGTMSQFCATCHGNFHTIQTATSDGIGPNAINPFIRHPTDLALPVTGEYAAYVTYDLQAPIARTVVPAASASNTNNAAVMCLSCHSSHASEYPDILRWDYTTMIVGNAGAATGTGCFVCHTTKD